MAEIIKAVMSSAAEAKLRALYINAREAVDIQNLLCKMGHPQPPMPMQTDNSMAEGIINTRVEPKQTKATGMRFHWLHDRCKAQNQFHFYWWAGSTNLGDYWMKHHPPTPSHENSQ